MVIDIDYIAYGVPGGVMIDKGQWNLWQGLGDGAYPLEARAVEYKRGGPLGVFFGGNLGAEATLVGQYLRSRKGAGGAEKGSLAASLEEGGEGDLGTDAIAIGLFVADHVEGPVPIDKVEEFGRNGSHKITAFLHRKSGETNRIREKT
jgi:hypothetical protein